MGSTLNLKKGGITEDKGTTDAKVPVFNPEDNYAEVHTEGGVKCFLQLKNFFYKHGDHLFAGEAPQHMWMEPLNAEQRKNLAISRQKNKAFFQAARPKLREAGIPQQVIDAERENAKVLAAETQAA